jgi:hypothetical protein
MFNIQHAMTCKKGGLVISHHNEIRDELADIASKALIASAVRNKPSICPHAGCADYPAKASDTKQTSPSQDSRLKPSSCDEDRGDLLISAL